jgi:ABC-2 type transport system ATP-binding protein
MMVLQVKNLVKHFVDKPWWKPWQQPKVSKALDGISFEINEGEIIGLLGPNGAGKTTTTQLLLGNLIPTSGEIYYLGQKFDYKNKDILEKVNFSSAYIDLPHRLTVRENLEVYARLYGVKNWGSRIDRLLDEFDSLPLKNKKIHDLSAGQKTRILLAKTFINYPRIILLDEPTASLDPEIAVKVRRFLLNQQRHYKVAVLFTSHNMHEVEDICDRIIFLNKGKIIDQDTPLGLVRRLKKTQLRLLIDNGREKLEQYLKQNKFSYRIEKGKYIIDLEEDKIPKVLYRISEQGVRYSEIEVKRPTLEDYFIRKVEEGSTKA